MIQCTECGHSLISYRPAESDDGLRHLLAVCTVCHAAYDLTVTCIRPSKYTSFDLDARQNRSKRLVGKDEEEVIHPTGGNNGPSTDDAK